jgi:hypothetical protein
METQVPTQKGNIAYAEPMRALLSRNDQEDSVVGAITRLKGLAKRLEGLPLVNKRQGKSSLDKNIREEALDEDPEETAEESSS